MADSRNGGGVVLLTTFTSRGKRFKVVYHDGKIVWDTENQNRLQVTLPMENVIAVRPCYLEQSNSVDAPVVDSNQFVIHYAVQGAERSMWRAHSITFKHTEREQVSYWIATLQAHVKTFDKRPQHLLLFINPYGGRRNALQLYERYGKPLFEVAGVDVTVNVSQRRNQIGDYVLRHGLHAFDAVACAGGDGTVSELFNALVLRECRATGTDPDDLRSPLPKPLLPVGIIPGGSTNTIAYCLYGSTDVTTSVLHIIFGDRLGLDLVGVYDDSHLLRLYASVLSYGYLGDVAYQSDAYRWMGPKRYDYTGFKKILQNRGYVGEVAILSRDTCSLNSSIMTMDRSTLGDSISDDVDNDCNTSVLTECYANCPVCRECSDKVIASGDHTDDSTTTARHCNKLSDKQEKHHEVGDDSADGDDGLRVMAAASKEAKQQKVPLEQWRYVRGTFFMVSGANISCACDRTPRGMAPYSHLGDGTLHLIIVRKTSIWNVLRLLMRLTGRRGIADLPFVEVHRATEFCFRLPEGAIDTAEENRLFHNNREEEGVGEGGDSNAASRSGLSSAVSSVWNCDGEVLGHTQIRAKVWCQLLTVFSRHRMPEKEKPARRCCGFSRK